MQATPLSLAAERGHQDVAFMFLWRGADVNSRDDGALRGDPPRTPQEARDFPRHWLPLFGPASMLPTRSTAGTRIWLS